MNDLVDYFDVECDPVDLNGKSVSCLLYADDIVSLSQSAKGLQNLLNKLKLFCDKWNLSVNTEKTKVMIFNKSGRKLKGYSFFYAQQSVGQASEYKYLGIIFKPSGSFLCATDQLSKKACTAMFCIQKYALSDNMNIYGHIKLFNACVQPILLYCSEVWSLFTLIKGNVKVELKYDSFIPNKVQMKYAKYMLGVHKSATNIDVLAELGLYPLSIAALKSSVIYWIPLLNSKCNSLIFQAYRENMLLIISFYFSL